MITRSWKWRDLDLKAVFARQDFAQWMMTCFIIIGVVVPTAVATPRNTVYFVYDASIGLVPRPNFEPTVPTWVPVVVPLLCVLFTVIVGEMVSRHALHTTLTNAVATALYFFLDAVQAFITSMLLVQVTKMVVGRPRPDFLSRCAPVLPDPAVIPIVYGQDNVHSWECTRPYDHTLKDGYMSFPSGHAAAAFTFSTYAAAYLIWSWSMRLPEELGFPSFRERFLHDLRNVCAKVWLLLLMSFAWGVTLSRVIDNQHHVSDVLGGAFAGTLIALIYALRAIPRYRRVLSLDDDGTVWPVSADRSDENLRRLTSQQRMASRSVSRADSARLAQVLEDPTSTPEDKA